VMGGTPIEPWIVKRMPFRETVANDQHTEA
jgi:hypothetical protein